MFSSVALVASLVKSAAFPTNNVLNDKEQIITDISPDLVKAVTAELKKEIDAVSTTESQVTIVDEETTIVLQSRVRNAIQYLLTPYSEDSKVKLLDANHSVSYIAYGLSDIVFVYSGLASDEYSLGQELSNWASSAVRNVNHQLVKVVQMETRAGALQAVQGVLADSQEKSVSVLTTSQALLSMIPNLQALALNHQPVVFHVAAQSVDQDLIPSPSLDAVLTARNTGAILLSSANAQEAHDMAIVAHLLAHSVHLPVIHFFNGVTAAKQIEKVNLTSYVQLAQLRATPHHTVQSLSSYYTESYKTTQTLLAQFNYKPFEYTGAEDAETVLVALNATAASIDQAVQRATEYLKTSVGLVRVRVFRPWSESDFITILPKSVRRVVVLEEGAGLYSFNGPLYLDIAASIRFGSLAHDRRPRLVSAQASDYSHLHATHLPSLIKEAELENFINLAAEPFSDSISDETVALEKSDAAWSAIFWDSVKDNTATAALHDAHLLEALQPDVKARVRHDAYRLGGPVTQTHLTYGPLTTAPHRYIEIHNVSLIREYNTLANAAQGATIVLHGPWKHGDELEGILSNEFKFGLTHINAKLYTVDASRIAQEHELNIKSSHLIWEAVFLILSQQQQQQYLVDQLSALYEELEFDETKYTLTDLITRVVNSVKDGLTEVELLPPWTILEVSDDVLPSTPLDRLVNAQEDVAKNEDDTAEVNVNRWHKAAWHFMFNEAYHTETEIRPDLHEKTFLIRVSENRRLTPESYDRNVFHIEFDTTESNLRYELGDALGVHGHNDYQEVQDFLDWYGLNGNDVISIKTNEDDTEQVRSVFQLFSQTLDIFGRPSKKFYESLAAYATDPKEREQLLYLISPEGKEDFKKRVDDTVTYEDLLREFISVKPPLEVLVQLIAPIKPRHYSIASSQKMYNHAVHLLVVAVDWEVKGKKRHGQCTRYLSRLNVGDQVTVSIKPSVMKLPPLDSQPVIMAGLGTGMAPFRAFIQERYLAKLAGKEVGPVVLYFGSRHRSMEYLYGEELEAYHADGVLSHIGLAFSRDQKEKVYIQHKMMEDAEMLSDYLMNKKGHFYLCGPTWPVPDVKDAVVHGLTKYGGVDATTASALIEEWKEKESYILEVY
ncbi:uncharacterized protein BX663DRAFT_493266 [Cokeromyces recurvatus]|uniref:uncharacterized protein n=1 Tax=Cokeromyces recurvatus TaxID=90255 RepID=UPI00221E3AD3|nr:uncharacterized protein BX663DRAFT_493266 [Cokeromyces recurvatus]KAI7908169.1 hypothetical protein BX663DRAFT_493266 [Cokeromyces recurvatus]